MHGRGYQAKVARESKVSSAHIANIITKEEQTVGMRTANKLAGFWGMTLDRLMATAVEWARSAPAPPTNPLARRRPNLELAIETLRRDGVLAEKHIEEARRTGNRDFSIGAWMVLLGEMIQAERNETASAVSTTVGDASAPTDVNERRNVLVDPQRRRPAPPATHSRRR